MARPRAAVALPPTDDAAREVVLQRVAREVRKFPELGLEPLETDGLEARDAAFAHALYDAVVRRWITLQWMVERVLRDPWEELEWRMRACLLVGAAQLVFLDKVPPRAAVHGSVNWAKRAIRPGAGSLANAALRRVSEMIERDGADRPVKREKWSDKEDEIPLADGTALILKEERLHNDAMRRLEVATSCPLPLLRAWSKVLRTDQVRAMALHTIVKPPIVLNTAFVREEGEGETGLADVTTAHSTPGHRVFTGTHDRLMRVFKGRADVWAQDAGSSAAVMMVSDLKPSVVIDVCAGLGTKTRQLFWTFPEAKIVASDVNEARVKALKNEFKKAPWKDRVEVATSKELLKWVGKGDLVVVDAPCSNSGVLARRVEAKYRFDEESVTSLEGVQRQILADAVRLLTPVGAGQERGKLLYSTCSVDRRENEAQAAWMERWHAMKTVRTSQQMPEGNPGTGGAERYADGSFAALMG
ncbi:MAG: transcription antitermination factor NusB [Phycisphaerales bacterium]